MSFIDRFKKGKEREKKVEPTPESRVEKKSKETDTQKALPKNKIGKFSGILVKPLVTEKASFIGQYGQYVFEVNPRANKIEVAKAFLNTYGVKPVSVNITSVKGKEIRYGRTKGRTKNRKKAFITLPPGAKIEVHEGV